MTTNTRSAQESVWDYPRPPRVENTNRRVQVIFQGETIAESRRAKRVLETSHPPVYYLPPEDVRQEFLHPSSRTSFCEFKGVAHYWTVRVGEREAPNAAWSYPRPSQAYEAIRDHLAFYPGAMDACLVLAHDITEIRPGEHKGPAFQKGHIIQEADICHLQRLGKRHVYAIDVQPGFLHEDEAAQRLARAFCGPGVSWQGKPREGKLNLIATRDGLLKVDRTSVIRINMLAEVMCATRHTNTVVTSGEAVAAVRAIPLIIRSQVIEKAERLVRKHQGLVRVKPLKKAQVGIVDLPPLVVPSFKLGWGSSQARDPGGAERSQDLWESAVWPQVRVADNPKHYEA